MATEKELEEEMERLRAQVQGLASDLEDAKTGLAAFGKATVKGAGDITKGLGSFATQVGRGDTSFKSLNSVVDIASNALAGMAKAIPYAGEALAAGIKATAEASKFMLEQLDQTTKAFNDLSRVGALTEAGMSGLQKQFVQSGLTLSTFQKQITDNAQALARFRGMAGDGADAFSEIAGKLTQGGDDSLRRLGMSADQIGESTAAFVTQQTRLGLAQGKSNAELAAGTKAYAIELDALQKITGQSREAIQKQQDAALSEARFRANYDELIAQGREGEAKQLMKLQTQLSGFGELGQGVRDLISGAGTDSARRLMASTGGAAQQILERVKAGQIDSTQAAMELQAAMKANAASQRNNAKYVDKSSSAFADYANVADFTNAKIVNGQIVRDRQEKQMTKGQDELTDTTVDAEKSIQKMNIEMQRLGFTFLPEASKAVDAMTKSMSKFVEFVNQKIGGGGTGEAAQKEKEAKAAYDKAMEGATFAQKYLGIGRTKEQEEAYNAYYKAQLAATQARSQGPQANNLSTPSAGVVPGKSVTIGDEVRTGGDRNWRNNNPGNIEYGPFAQKMGAVGSDGRFAIFPNEEMGRKAADALLKGSAYANLNIKDAINKWAPPSENDTNAYVNAFKQAGLDPTKRYADLSPQDQQKFLDIQKRVEGGRAGTVTSGGVLGAGTLATGGVTPPVVAGPSAPYQPTTAAVQPAEKLSPTPAPAPQSQQIGGGTDNAILLAQLGKLDEMISIMKNQLGVQTKQLQLTH
jgi:hypothetical protein